MSAEEARDDEFGDEISDAFWKVMDVVKESLRSQWGWDQDAAIPEGDLDLLEGSAHNVTARLLDPARRSVLLEACGGERVGEIERYQSEALPDSEGVVFKPQPTSDGSNALMDLPVGIYPVFAFPPLPEEQERP